MPSTPKDGSYSKIQSYLDRTLCEIAHAFGYGNLG
jgi:hypothetical protein